MIPKIVITGGPCSGKTTALPMLKEELIHKGFRVFSIPETATMLNLMGIILGDEKTIFQAENSIMLAQIGLENLMVKYTEYICSDRRCVILCDRGLMDIKAYIDLNGWNKLLKRHKIDEAKIMARYFGVFHLETIAFGVEELFDLLVKNNPARIETSINECRAADLKTRNCWIGHDHLRVIDNRENNFENKLKRLLGAICARLGVPAPIEIERKFVVKELSVLPSQPIAKVNIQQAYIINEDDSGVEKRIRARTYEGGTVYYLTTKIPRDDGVRHETTKEISASEYQMLMATKLDYSRRIINKKRICFLYNNQYFELDVFGPPLEPLMILEIELTDINDKVDIPDFIRVEKEVTNDPRYYNYQLAKI